MYYPALTKEYLQRNSLVGQFIESYDKFVAEGMQVVVDSQGVIEPQVENLVLKLGKISVGQPSITEADGSRRIYLPMEARLRDISYSSPIFLEITPYFSGSEGRTETVFIGELPVMTKSKLCYLSKMGRDELIAAGEDPMDQGGYFVINGTEKALMSIEDLAPNRVFVSREKENDLVQAKVFSTRLGFRGRITVDRQRDGRIFVTMPSFNKSVEFTVLLKALGLDKPEKVNAAFSDFAEIHNDLQLNMEADKEIKTRKDALESIGKKAAPGQPVDYQLKRAELLIDRYLLPHIGVEEKDRMAKAYYLCRMTERAILVAYRKRKVEDKDHYSNKRLKISGKLMEELFRYAFQFFVKDVAYQLERANIRHRKMTLFTIVRPDALTERMKYSMATGNWMGGHTGVCQPVDRYNFISALAFARRVISPLAKKHPHHKARDLHGTHFGRLDPNETPEGPNCIAPQTPVLLDNETSVTIGEYERHWGNERLLSADWGNGKKLAASGIGRYIKFNSREYDAFRITTSETGRTIIATPDHPFFAPEGKIELKGLQVGSRVAVLPGRPLAFEAAKEKTILDEEQLAAALPPKSDFEYAKKELVQRRLLPLKTTDKRAAVIARLAGHLFGDGCLSYSMRTHKSVASITFTGTEEDLHDIADDVKNLGFAVSAITVHHARSQLANGQIIEGDTTRMSCYSKPLYALFAALGAPVGEKTEKQAPVPEWITAGSRLLQREFLAAYFGSEMTRPRMQKKGRNFTSPAFSLNKTEERLEDGVAFVVQIQKMLGNFGVSIAYTRIAGGTVRRDGKATKKIKAVLSTRPESMLALYGTIGFAYCKSRQALARFGVEYCEFKQRLLSRRVLLAQQALALHADGRPIAVIASTLAVPRHSVADWLRSSRKMGSRAAVHVPASSIPSFPEFIAEHAASGEGLCWESIEKIEPVKVSDVRDVTTLTNHHNFFANGFLTGNCGLIKSLAMFCEVTSGADEKPVESALKKIGVTMHAT
ncbi:MAG: DNA-directed RNA polymerase subunit B'' [Candidatus Micrarchaeota archaeon]